MKWLFETKMTRLFEDKDEMVLETKMKWLFGNIYGMVIWRQK